MSESELKYYSKQQLKRTMLFYKARMTILKNLIKSGIMLDLVFPFILSGLVLLYGGTLYSKPYVLEEKDKYINGFDQDDEIRDRTFIYSTGWLDNKRTEITFKLNGQVDLEDATSIIEMSEEDLRKAFNIVNIKTIYKDEGTVDYINTSEMIIIPIKDGLLRSKMHKEITSEMFMYLAISFICGLTLKKFEDVATNTFIKTELKNKLLNLENISDEEIHAMKNIYDRKQEFPKKKTLNRQLKFRKI